MIKRKCWYCKYVNSSTASEPCKSCFCKAADSSRIRPNFELDLVKYFKSEMKKLAKRFNAELRFIDLPHNVIRAVFAFNDSKNHEFAITSGCYQSEAQMVNCVEHAKKWLYEITQQARTYADNRTIPKIKDVKFNGPATIVFWEDGTKTVVKCQNGDTFDPEKGLAMAIAKKALGNEDGYYSENIGKWVENYQKEQVMKYFAELDEFGKRFARDFYNSLKLRGVDD